MSRDGDPRTCDKIGEDREEGVMDEPIHQDPHDHDHKHPDVSGGWLRAAVFGAMDGLVSNISLIAGIGAAGASSGTIVLTGVAGLVAGSFSMALGEYTSVKTQNEQVDSELDIEREAHDCDAPHAH